MIKRPTTLTPTASDAALALDACLAKTYSDKDLSYAGRNVLNHCHIVGAVARELIERLQLNPALFPQGAELIAACHDIGKVSPTFQKKIYSAIKQSPPQLAGINADLEQNWGGHAAVSQVTADALNVGNYIPQILGQHHGYSPAISNLVNDAVFGGKAWQQRRAELVSELKRLLGCDFPQVTSLQHARVLAGLTSVADWLGSSPLFNDPLTDPQPLIAQALDEAGFIQPSIKTGLSFSDIFGFEPRASQQKFAASATQAGVYLLEAPMGQGKTEAALYAAYQCLCQGTARGIYFALPTQLTSEKIHERVNQFLTKILEANSPQQNALLLHSHAWLKALAVEGNPNGSWFDAKKRGILAPFAVGTIDQALMAVMNVKHGFVRSFGLAGKVVILDEVHSYDSYTGTILETLVKALRELDCTVLILSATLTQERREKFVEQAVVSHDYPLISCKPNQGALTEISLEPLDNHHVRLAHCQQQTLAINEALHRAAQGEQVLWIENTVDAAQAVFEQLASHASGIECGLLHSRFLKVDRDVKENYWVNLYGKDKPQARQETGRILVGTQVLEQSLDIDADFLVSRFAPTDMVLQRLGRLWRHDTTPRPANAQRQAWLLAPELTAAIADISLFGNSAKVYAPYVLCRSLQVWQERTTVALPADIRALLEATYCERAETASMQVHKGQLEKKREVLMQLARLGLSTSGETFPETVSTRYSEQETVQVLLLRDYQTDQRGTQLTLLNGEVLHLGRYVKTQDARQWRYLAAQVLKNCVQVAAHLAPAPVSIKDLSGLGDFVYLGKPALGESVLRVAKVSDDDSLRSLLGGTCSQTHQLSYNARVGYVAKKV